MKLVCFTTEQRKKMKMRSSSIFWVNGQKNDMESLIKTFLFWTHLLYEVFYSKFFGCLFLPLSPGICLPNRVLSEYFRPINQNSWFSFKKLMDFLETEKNCIYLVSFGTFVVCSILGLDDDEFWYPLIHSFLTVFCDTLTFLSIFLN